MARMMTVIYHGPPSTDAVPCFCPYGLTILAHLALLKVGVTRNPSTIDRISIEATSFSTFSSEWRTVLSHYGLCLPGRAEIGLCTVAERELNACLAFCGVLEENVDSVWLSEVGKGMPWWQRWTIRYRVRNAVLASAATFGLVSLGDVHASLLRICPVFDRVLADAPFLGGEAPGDADVALFARVSIALRMPWARPVMGEVLRQFPRLVEHEARMRDLCFDTGENASLRAPKPANMRVADKWGRIGTLGRIPVRPATFAPMTRRDYEKKRNDFFFALGGLAMVGVFYANATLSKP